MELTPQATLKQRFKASFKWREYLMVVLFNSLIAVFLALLTEASLTETLVFSQAIGLCIMTTINLFMLIQGQRFSSLGMSLLGIIVGGLGGILLGGSILGLSVFSLLRDYPGLLTITGSAAIVFGVIVSYFFYSREKLLQSDIDLKAAHLQRLEQEKRLTETNLRLLQAQIEPHFLFNTLSNVVGLIDREPEDAKQMLINLTSYLRASLGRTRKLHSTLGDELEFVTAYLDIQQIRMGERLSYTIDCDPALQALRLPPLLIQPLVENAIRHGIEPSSGGGRIEIQIEQAEQQLRLKVSDNGLGLNASDSTGSGVGLENIRQRLLGLYGPAAKLNISSAGANGVQALIQIPVPTSSPTPTQDVT